ncbi:MAG: hypothetical protein M9924_11980 [Rhizobiaceae bacterium]|nr:hypothetical protein [Rhizobiaceae bacterium]
MSYNKDRGRKAPYLQVSDIYPDATGIGDARRAALAFALGGAERAPAARKPHRAMLPDVDPLLAVEQPRRSLFERLFGAPRALKNHHKPSSSAV